MPYTRSQKTAYGKMSYTAIDYMFTNCQCDHMEITPGPKNGTKRMSDHNVLYTDIKVTVKHRSKGRDYSKHLKLNMFFDHTDSTSTDPDDLEHKETVKRNINETIQKLRDMSFREKVIEMCTNNDPIAAYDYYYKTIVKILEEVCGVKQKGSHKAKCWWTTEYGKRVSANRKLYRQIRQRKYNKQTSA